jgi:hypothetical protein
MNRQQTLGANEGANDHAAGFLRRLRHDESGAIMVIAIFMSACIVGCIWYMYGLGEAMVYRQQLRAASDATAFEAAVLHAVGMNAVSMINIAMAVVLSILVFFQILFVLSLVVTILAALILLIPGIDLLDIGVMPGLIKWDTKVFNIINKIQNPIFDILTALNISAGVEAIAMPWVAHFSGRHVPDDYAPAAEEGDFWQPFSWSMIPNRVPFFSNALEGKSGKWTESLLAKVPVLKNLKPLGFSPNLAKVATSRYGLPVQDDKYPVLCMHATEELFDEFSSLIGAFTGGDGPDLSGISYWFGIFVGQFPSIFCEGTDPMKAIAQDLGIGSGIKDIMDVLGPLKKFGWFKTLSELADDGKNATGGGGFNPNYDPSAPKDSPNSKQWLGGQKNRVSPYPMKPYDLFQNGNGFGQVWAIINGNEALTTGAATGVDVASWGASSVVSDSGQNGVDFAEAEFYYDCGPNAGPEAAGRGDSGGVWLDCKYNAMWNMKWKARLRRYQEFDLDALKMGELALYNAIGAESFVQKIIGLVPGLDPNGVGVKYGLIDSFKSCFTSVGQGKAGELSPGACPIPAFGSSGFGDVGFGWNSSAPGVTDYSKVFH